MWYKATWRNLCIESTREKESWASLLHCQISDSWASTGPLGWATTCLSRNRYFLETPQINFPGIFCTEAPFMIEKTQSSGKKLRTFQLITSVLLWSGSGSGCDRHWTGVCLIAYLGKVYFTINTMWYLVFNSSHSMLLLHLVHEGHVLLLGLITGHALLVVPCLPFGTAPERL